MKEEKITTEDLARMVQEGFAETAKKREMEARFNQVDKRLDKVDGRLDKVDGRLDGLEVRAKGVETRLDGVNDNLERIEKLLIADHRKRIERIEIELKDLRNLLSTR